MGHPLVGDGVIDRLGGDVAAAHHGAADDRHHPDVVPVVAVKERHDREIRRIARHVPAHHRAHGHEIRAAMVIDDALGPPGGAGGVVEREALPFVFGHDPLEIRIAGLEQRLVIRVIRMRVHARRVVGHLDDGGGGPLHQAERRRQHPEELRVAEHHARLAVIEDVGDGVGLEPRVDGVEHRPRRRHAEMRLALRGDVGQDRRHHIARRDPQPDQRRGEPRAAGVILAIGLAVPVIDHRLAVGENARRAPQMRQRRQRGEIRLRFPEPGFIPHPAHAVLPRFTCRACGA